MNAETLDELQGQVGQWQTETFGAQHNVEIVLHLMKEVCELAVAVGMNKNDISKGIKAAYDSILDGLNGVKKVHPIPHEAADNLLLLLGLSYNKSFSLFDAALMKFTINLGRRWGAPGPDGVVEHLEEISVVAPPPFTPAPRLLMRAAEIMEERGRQYDNPEGERSMGKAVEAFNTITGSNLSEAQGWLLLQILKDVRQWQHPGYHADSAEDCIAYSALKAEALQKEGKAAA